MSVQRLPKKKKKKKENENSTYQKKPRIDCSRSTHGFFVCIFIFFAIIRPL